MKAEEAYEEFIHAIKQEIEAGFVRKFGLSSKPNTIVYRPKSRDFHRWKLDSRADAIELLRVIHIAAGMNDEQFHEALNNTPDNETHSRGEVYLCTWLEPFKQES